MSDETWEYVVTRTDELGSETTHDTRHDAVAFKAIAGRHTPDDVDYEVDHRRKYENEADMTKDALWRAEIVDRTGDEWEHIGWTLLYEARSFAADAAYLYMLANHLDEVSVKTMPWYGSSYKKVGEFGREGNRYPVYLGYEDEEPIEHDANALQYSKLYNHLTYERM